MRLRKVVNRVYQGTTYYRWVLSLPPRNVRDLGWVDGQPLQTTVRGSVLWIEPAAPVRRSRGRGAADAIETETHRRSVARR